MQQLQQAASTYTSGSAVQVQVQPQPETARVRLAPRGEVLALASKARKELRRIILEKNIPQESFEANFATDAARLAHIPQELVALRGSLMELDESEEHIVVENIPECVNVAFGDEYALLPVALIPVTRPTITRDGRVLARQRALDHLRACALESSIVYLALENSMSGFLPVPPALAAFAHQNCPEAGKLAAVEVLAQAFSAIPADKPSITLSRPRLGVAPQDGTPVLQSGMEVPREETIKLYSVETIRNLYASMDVVLSLLYAIDARLTKLTEAEGIESMRPMLRLNMMNMLSGKQVYTSYAVVRSKLKDTALMSLLSVLVQLYANRPEVMQAAELFVAQLPEGIRQLDEAAARLTQIRTDVVIAQQLECQAKSRVRQTEALAVLIGLPEFQQLLRRAGGNWRALFATYLTQPLSETALAVAKFIDALVDKCIATRQREDARKYVDAIHAVLSTLAETAEGIGSPETAAAVVALGSNIDTVMTAMNGARLNAARALSDDAERILQEVNAALDYQDAISFVQKIQENRAVMLYVPALQEQYAAARATLRTYERRAAKRPAPLADEDTGAAAESGSIRRKVDVDAMEVSSSRSSGSSSSSSESDDEEDFVPMLPKSLSSEAEREAGRVWRVLSRDASERGKFEEFLSNERLLRARARELAAALELVKSSDQLRELVESSSNLQTLGPEVDDQLVSYADLLRRHKAVEAVSKPTAEAYRYINKQRKLTESMEEPVTAAVQEAVEAEVAEIAAIETEARTIASLTRAEDRLLREGIIRQAVPVGVKAGSWLAEYIMKLLMGMYEWKSKDVEGKTYPLLEAIIAGDDWTVAEVAGYVADMLYVPQPGEVVGVSNIDVDDDYDGETEAAPVTRSEPVTVAVSLEDTLSTVPAKPKKVLRKRLT